MKKTGLPVLHELIEANPFASLITMGSSGLFASHIPMVLENDGYVSRATEVPRLPGQYAMAGLFSRGGGAGDLRWKPPLHQPNLVCGEASDRESRAYLELRSCPRVWKAKSIR